MQNMDRITEQKEDCSRKTGETLINLMSSSNTNVSFLILTNEPWLCKMLTLGETG